MLTFIVATCSVTGAPIESDTSGTLTPNNSANLGAIGAKENFASYPPLGRPRCEVINTLAPLSNRYLRVGIDPLIRVSSTGQDRGKGDKYIYV